MPSPSNHDTAVLRRPKPVKEPDPCLHCGSLDTVRKGHQKFCRDCESVMRRDEVVSIGILDLHYTLDVVSAEGRSLWNDSLYVLFQSQCDIAARLRIPPGSSFTKWLKTYATEFGVIDNLKVVETLKKIVAKMVHYQNYIEDPYHIDAIQQLHTVIDRAARLVLTYTKR